MIYVYHSGGTFVNSGTLLAINGNASLANSATCTGAVTIGNAAGVMTATLGGPGTVLGNATINPGSKITGGMIGTVGTLNLQANLTLAGTTAAPANFTVDIAGTTADQLAISGILTLSNASITVTGTPTENTTYVLATYASETGTFSGTPPANFEFRFNTNGTELDLVPVPEPATWAAFGLVGLIGLARRRNLATWLERLHA